MKTLTLTISDALTTDTFEIRLINPLGNFLDCLKTWNKRVQYRRQLANFPTYYLQDIGWSENDVFLEVNKPFWRE